MPSLGHTTIKLDEAAVTTGDIVNTGTGTKITAAPETGKVSTLTGSILAKGGDITQTGSLKAESLVVGVAASGTGDTAIAASTGAYTVNGTLGVKTVSLVNGSAKVTGEKVEIGYSSVKLFIISFAVPVFKKVSLAVSSEQKKIST